MSLNDNQKDVIIPIEEWNKFNIHYEKMTISNKNKQYILNNIERYIYS